MFFISTSDSPYIPFVGLKKASGSKKKKSHGTNLCLTSFCLSSSLYYLPNVARKAQPIYAECRKIWCLLLNLSHHWQLGTSHSAPHAQINTPKGKGTSQLHSSASGFGIWVTRKMQDQLEKRVVLPWSRHSLTGNSILLAPGKTAATRDNFQATVQLIPQCAGLGPMEPAENETKIHSRIQCSAPFWTEALQSAQIPKQQKNPTLFFKSSVPAVNHTAICAA